MNLGVGGTGAFYKKELVMDWKVFDAFESKASAINAIMVVDVESRRVVMSNSLGIDYFSKRDNLISLQGTLGLDTDVNDLFQSVVEDLGDNLQSILEETTVVDKFGEEVECNIVFTFATPDQKLLFMKVHPIIDNKPYYLEKFIESRRRPAFTLNVNENLTVNHGNPDFYKCFACNKTSMKLRYKNYFGNLLSEDMRMDYEAKIHEAVKDKPSGILDIPVQTAMGEVLYFYFDTQRLKQVETDCLRNLFCLLVSKEDTEADLCNPFESRE